MSWLILKFKIPEEKEEAMYAERGMDYHSALMELDNWLRNKSKYEEQDSVTIEEVRSKIHELIDL